MESLAEPCELLPWDSKFFGFPVARVLGDILTTDHSDAIERWCEEREIQCLYFLARSDDAGTVALAEARGFHLVDVRMTLEQAVSDAPRSGTAKPASGIRGAEIDDLPELRRIARLSHTDTRFFFDGRFLRERCESLYETWIQSSFEGFAQAVFVSEVKGRIAGYVTCHLSKEGDEGSIGLIAVDAPHQGKGLGRQLVAAAMEWFTSQNVHPVSVVTQGRNIAAQRLYARTGFIPRTLELYYHCWLLRTDKDRR